MGCHNMSLGFLIGYYARKILEKVDSSGVYFNKEGKDKPRGLVKDLELGTNRNAVVCILKLSLEAMKYIIEK